MKIAQKLLLVILVTCLIPLTGVGVAALAISQSALRGQIQTRIDNTARHQLDRLNAVNTQIGTELNNIEFTLQLRLLLEEYEAAPSTALQAELQQALTPILSSEDTFHEVYVTDNNGRVLAATDASLVGRNEAQTEPFRAAQQAPTSSLFFKDSQGEIEQYLAVPLTLNSQHLGVAIVEATAQPYLVITKDYSELGLTGESYLARRTNTSDWQYLTPLRFEPAAVLTSAGQTPLGATDYRGHTVVVARRSVPGTDWALIVKIDTAEVEAPIVRMRDILAFIVSLTAIVAIVCSWYAARYITAPIKRMTNVVTQIRNGNLSLQVDVRSRDEIGILGNAFNEMKNSLVATEARLKASIGSLPFGFAIIDNQNRLVFHNQALEQLTNRSLSTTAEDSVKAIEGIGADFKAADVLGCIKQTLATKTTIEKNVEIGPKFFRLLFVPVIDSVSGLEEAVGSVFIMEDTTDKRAMERSRDEFFSIASHELRTPLTAIRGNSGMILQFYEEPLKDPELHQMVTDIHDASTRLISIVNDFLDMSRLEQGKFVFKSEPFDIAALITEILREFDVTGSRRKLKLELKPPVTNPPVYADKERTRQIIVNLLGNAIKFTKQGGVTLSLESATTMRLSVTDTGIGIPVASQHLLFRKFQQASGSILTRDNTQSTGLGLYISKMLAEGMGGTLVLARTEEGKGSTFVLELPVDRKTVEQQQGEKLLGKAGNRANDATGS